MRSLAITILQIEISFGMHANKSSNNNFFYERILNLFVKFKKNLEE